MSKAVAEEFARNRSESAEKAHLARQRVADYQREIDLAELSIKNEVACATDDAGKALFSNEDKRRAEVARRCAGSKEISDLRQALRAAEDEAAKESIQAQYFADLVNIEVAFAVT